MSTGIDNVPATAFADTGQVRRRAVPDDVPALHPDPVAHRVLAARGIRSRDELALGLDSLPPPDALPDIELAVTRLIAARDAGERVLVVGDYDCDGATSTAVAVLGLEMLGFRRPAYRVPNRFRDGYGLSPIIVEQCLHDGEGEPLDEPPTLILTVDNGIASVDGVARARDAGVDVVVTDHHLPPALLPEAIALVNPNRIGARFASGALAGVGVMFYVLLAVRARLRARRSRHETAMPESSAMPDLVEAAEAAVDEADASEGEVRPTDPQAGADAPLAELLDLVAIGTVADVVPLDRVNRVLVQQGIRRIRAGRTREGVLALLRTAAREPARLEAEDIGFALGPRLNAAGRLADMSIGIACLLSENGDEAQRLADELDGFNRERRRIEAGMRDEAELRLAASEIAQTLPDDQPDGARPATRFGVVLADPGWHEGVLGILAGRLKERLHRPVVTLTRADEGRLKGSARSIEGVHVRDVLQAIAARQPGLLFAFGGHAMAAGLTLRADGLTAFAAAFDEEVARRLGDRLPEREWSSDGELDDAGTTLAQARLLASLGPFGQAFEPPIFDGHFTVLERRIVGQGHLKLVVARADAHDGSRLDAIAFNHPAEPPVGAVVRLVYRLDINVYRDVERLQLKVDAILEPDMATGPVPLRGSA